MRRLLVVALLLAVALPAAAQDRSITLLPSRTITAAVTGVTTDAIMLPRGTDYLAVQAVFVRGSGGTTTKAWVQTSLDGGSTWVDIMCFAFTTTTATKVSAVTTTTALAAGATPTDGSLADNTILSGLLGDRVRVKWTTTGTYASSSLTLTAAAN